MLDELETAGLVTLADKDYQGSTWAKIPYEGKGKPESQKEANRALGKVSVTNITWGVQFHLATHGLRPA